ncbi:MAG: hypothetical protein AAFY26_04940, partial [Cyanobacteria bacterium J06638_22]
IKPQLKPLILGSAGAARATQNQGFSGFCPVLRSQTLSIENFPDRDQKSFEHLNPIAIIDCIYKQSEAFEGGLLVP